MLALLNDIAVRLSADPDALALLALGSAGTHQERLDEHSDLDFFVIALDKSKFLDHLEWLGFVEWWHRDTPDGCKALVNGIYCEFAVFLPEELPVIRFEAPRVVWRRDGVSVAEQNVPDPAAQDWLVDEVLSNLYVGLHRWLRGERLSAMRMVQGEGLDNLLRLLGSDDPFAPARRAERLGLAWQRLAGGYDRTPEAAQAILETLPAGGGRMRDEVAGLVQQALR
jgi:hypothetical protein